MNPDMWTFIVHWWATGLVLSVIAYSAAVTWYLARSPELQTVQVARCLLALSGLPAIAAIALTLAGAAWWSLAVTAATSAAQFAACLRHLRAVQLIRTGRPPEQASFLIRRRAA
jgi:hypothetical protein